MSRGSETAAGYRKVCRTAHVCIGCKGPLGDSIAYLCGKCQTKASERVVQRRFDRRVDKESWFEYHGWIPFSEAALILEIHRVTVFRYVKRGWLDPRVCYRKWYVERSKVYKLRRRLENTVRREDC